jgi:hypothetical protein
MTDYKRRIALGLMLLLYCFVLYLAFDFAFTALTMGDPRRYRIFDYRYHHSLIANFDGYDYWGTIAIGCSQTALASRTPR